MNRKIKIRNSFVSALGIGLFLLWTTCISVGFIKTAEAVETEINKDKILYEKYEQYLNYEKHLKYKEYSERKAEYEKYRKKYGFSSSKERRQHKSAYKKYKKYKKNKSKYSHYKKYKKRYKRYRKYKDKYEPAKEKYGKVRKYKKYQDFAGSKYGKREYGQQGGEAYRQGWERYKKVEDNKDLLESIAEKKGEAEDAGEVDEKNGAVAEENKENEASEDTEEKNLEDGAENNNTETNDEVEKNSNIEGEVIATSETEINKDKILYEKYEQYLNYEKHLKYKEYSERKAEYEKYRKKYGFSSSKERRQHKSAYKKYKKYKKNKSKYSHYKKYKKRYKRYRKYKDKYEPAKEKYGKVRKYKKYQDFADSKYGKREYGQQGGEAYRQGWTRYKQEHGQTAADLSSDSFGPEITVGLVKFSKDDLKNGSFRVRASKDYVVKDLSGKILGTIPAKTVTKVRYDSDGKLKISSSMDTILVDREVNFEATIAEEKDLIFEVLSPHIDCYSSNCNQYRSGLKLRYSPYSKKIWLINVLPLEQYVWGMGEITGTGDRDYNDTMTTAYRTYGYWKIKYSTKFASEGFKINATPGNQLYFGYLWEKKHQRIKESAQKTRGKLVMYSDRIAIVPYSSWTDGRTRSFKEKWGSDNFPWCQSVKDSYGKHPTKNYSELQASGNHMVGLSAHGALDRAAAGWSYEKILKYYLKGVTIQGAY